MSIPDKANADELAKLLAEKSGNRLPIIHLDKEHPTELGALIGLLINSSSGDGPGVGGLAHAAICLLATMEDTLQRQCAKEAASGGGIDSTMRAVILSMEATRTAASISLVREVMEGISARLDVQYDGAVSEDFLQSIGMSQRDWKEFVKRGRRV